MTLVDLIPLCLELSFIIMVGRALKVENHCELNLLVLPFPSLFETIEKPTSK